MMYIIYNADGSIKCKSLTEYIQQGNNNVNKVFVAFTNKPTPDFVLSGHFVLPNGAKVVKYSQETGQEIVEGTTYNGVYMPLTSEVTALAGVLKMNIQALDETDDSVLTSYSTFFTINEGVNPEGIAMMSEDEYNRLLGSLNLKLDKNSTILKTNALPENAEGYENGQALYVCNSDHSISKLYQKQNGEWVLIIDFNFVNAYINMQTYLGLWDCETGDIEASLPENPYEYKGGDYFRVSESGVRIPLTSYTIGETNYEEGETTINAGDIIMFNGGVWQVLPSTAFGVRDVTYDGESVVENSVAILPIPENQRKNLIVQFEYDEETSTIEDLYNFLTNNVYAVNTTAFVDFTDGEDYHSFRLVSISKSPNLDTYYFEIEQTEATPISAMANRWCGYEVAGSTLLATIFASGSSYQRNYFQQNSWTSETFTSSIRLYIGSWDNIQGKTFQVTYADESTDYNVFNGLIAIFPTQKYFYWAMCGDYKFTIFKSGTDDAYLAVSLYNPSTQEFEDVSSGIASAREI